jgi:hypothetical protein
MSLEFLGKMPRDRDLIVAKFGRENDAVKRNNPAGGGVLR